MFLQPDAFLIHIWRGWYSHDAPDRADVSASGTGFLVLVGDTGMSTKRKTGQSGIALLQSRSAAMLDEAQKRDISIAYRAALVAMTNDRGTEQLWHTLACALSIAGVMLELKLCPETRCW